MNHTFTSPSFPNLAAAKGLPPAPPKSAPLPANGSVDTAVPAPAAIDSNDPRPRWTSTELLRGSSEVLIEHDTATYRLRRTAQGKLILTK